MSQDSGGRAEVTVQERHRGCERLHRSYAWRRSQVSKLLPVPKLEIRSTPTSSGLS